MMFMVIIIKGKPATTKLDGFVQLLKKGRGPKKSSNLVVAGFQLSPDYLAACPGPKTDFAVWRILVAPS